MHTYIIAFLSSVFLFLSPIHPSRACSPSDFILDDFSKRCRSLAEQVRDTELAHRMDFPDAASRSALLLDSWLAFFLDHGVTPPPVYASMTGPAWEAGMRSMGTRIGELGRGEPVSPEALEIMTLPLELLASPQQLFPFQGALASLSLRITGIPANVSSATALLGPAQLAADPELVRSFALIRDLCENAPALRARLSTLYTSLTASPAPMGASSETMMSDEDRLALLELHLGSLHDELAFFSPIAFWQTPAIASQTLTNSP